MKTFPANECFRCPSCNLFHYKPSDEINIQPCDSFTAADLNLCDKCALRLETDKKSYECRKDEGDFSRVRFGALNYDELQHFATIVKYHEHITINKRIEAACTWLLKHRGLIK
jgi:hypothetical protein